MSNTKGALIRQKVIDRCLQSERGYSTAEMMEKCNDALDDRGYPLISSLNTIREDIQEISNSYCVNVVQVNKGSRSKRYHYADRNFSIYSSPLSDSDIANLNEIIQDICIFEGRPQLEWLADIGFRLQSSIDKEPVVVYDENPDLKGMEFFQPLFDAIKKKQALKLTYKNFKKDSETQSCIHPYMLRQYNKRWFLIAMTEGFENNLSNYALDRIVDIEEADIAYKPCDGRFDLSTYYNNVIGVTVPAHGVVENIELWVSNSLYPYIASKPIHHSQELVKEDEDGKVISLQLIPNYELEQLVLSYGSGIKVLSPEPLREKIKEKLKKSLENYD